MSLDRIHDRLRATHQEGQAPASPPPRPSPAPKAKPDSSGTFNLREPHQSPSVSDEELPTPIRQVKRPDVSMHAYGQRPDITNIQLYNYELAEFLTGFSKKNKKAGGNAITKSQLIEAILDVAYYDMELTPEGFSSTEEVREYLREQINKSKKD